MSALAGCALQSHSSQVTWSGDVDDAATVDFQGGRSWIDNATDKGVKNTSVVFHGTLPSTALTTVTLTKIAGRGQVELVQQPTKEDNYTAAVRVLDPEPGADHYQFVLKW